MSIGVLQTDYIIDITLSMILNNKHVTFLIASQATSGRMIKREFEHLVEARLT